MDAENWACSRSMRGILPDSVCWSRLGQHFWAHSRFVSELGQLVTLSISHVVDTGKFLNIWYYKSGHESVFSNLCSLLAGFQLKHAHKRMVKRLSRLGLPYDRYWISILNLYWIYLYWISDTIYTEAHAIVEHLAFPNSLTPSSLIQKHTPWFNPLSHTTE